MGMYTRLLLDVEVYPKYVDEVRAYIEYVPRLRSTSYYHNMRGQHDLVPDAYGAKAPIQLGSRETDTMYLLHCDISLKNYEYEIQDYLKFLANKVMPDENIAGFIQYEEGSEFPPQLLWVASDEKGTFFKVGSFSFDQLSYEEVR